jgi:hypothetical protein
MKHLKTKDKTKTKYKPKNKNKKTIKKQNNKSSNKTRGGFWPFSSEEKNPLLTKEELATKCPGANEKCDYTDTQYQGKVNQTWKTCINMNGINNRIIYITSNNVVIKSVETAQVPEFQVDVNNIPAPYKIKIEDKFVCGFLFICGEWYALMRLFGTTINVGVLARTEKNKAYYKLKHIEINIDTENPDNQSSNGSIKFPTDKITIIDDSYTFSTSKTKTIQVSSDCFENINKTNDPIAFNVLQRFRQEKVIGNAVKQELAWNLAETVFGVSDE